MLIQKVISSTQMKEFGRLLLASLFVISGAQSVLNFDTFTGSIAGKGFPMPSYVAILALILKLGGGLTLAFGIRPDLAVDALVIFTVMATILFHNPIVHPSQMTNFLKNLAIIGGLFLV